LDTILVISSSFLAGSLITALGFVCAFIGKVNRLENCITSLTATLKGHVENPGCALHLELEKQMSKNTEAIVNLERQAKTC
jgi:hypothetical protein